MLDWLRNMNWFAVHAKRFRETVAASSVAERGVEVFLPMVKVERPEREVIKVGSKPLFSGYFFARFRVEGSLESVESARGVLRVLKSGDCPIRVEEGVIAEIRDRVEADGLIRLQRDKLSPGDLVSIQEGPFAGMMGRVEAEIDDRKRVAILLEAFWNARVLIERRWVQAEAA